jgi:hypothetical protein
MATVGSTYLNLADAAKAKDPNGNTATVVELLAKTNSMIMDMPVVECNDGTRHKTTVRTGLPTVGYRQAYKGVTRSKSTRAQVTDSTAMMVAMQEVDEMILDLDSDPSGLMYSESLTFIESLNQQFSTDLLYADIAANPEKFHGFGPRYATLGDQVISAGTGGTNTNTSIYFVMWGPNTVHGLFPKGTKAGIEQRSRGKQRILDSNSDPYYAECVDWEWHVGLSVRDPRAVVRIANIDLATLVTAGASSDTSQDLLRAMDIAYGQMEGVANLGTSFKIYTNQKVRTYFRIQSQKKLVNSSLSWDMIQGPRPVMRFNGVPMELMDALSSTEATIS